VYVENALKLKGIRCGKTEKKKDERKSSRGVLVLVVDGWRWIDGFIFHRSLHAFCIRGFCRDSIYLLECSHLHISLQNKRFYFCYTI
jgi:hypothetical protein